MGMTRDLRPRVTSDLTFSRPISSLPYIFFFTAVFLPLDFGDRAASPLHMTRSLHMTMNDNISVTMDIFFIVSLFYSGLVGTHTYSGLSLPRVFFFRGTSLFIGVKLSFIAVMRYSNLYECIVRVKLLAERESTVDICIYLYIGL